MQFSFAILVLATTILDTALAGPLHHVHKRLHRLDLAVVLNEKRENWDDPSLYKGVDFTKINYGNAGAAAPAAAPVQAAAPAPAPKPATAPAPAAASPPAQNQAAAQPAAAPEKLSAAPVSSTNTNTGSGKRGLAYNPSSPNLNIFTGYGKITWGYNWASTPQGLPSQYEYVPMLHDSATDKLKAWPGDVAAATKGSGTHYLLSFNEPDMSTDFGGSAMDVGTAVEIYKQYVNNYASANVKLGAPAVSSSNDPGQGLNGWLKPFLQQCTGCTIDFIPVHWYGADPNVFKQYIQSAIDFAGGKPIWVTEFQCQGGDESAFLSSVLPWLDSQPGVARYAYFMASGKSLTNGDAVSAAGQKYGSA